MRLVIAVLLCLAMVGVAFAAPSKAPVGGPDDVKLDVGIYSGINELGNPIDANSNDNTVFTFHVTWTVTRTTSSGIPLSSTTSEVGYYQSSQHNSVTHTVGEHPTKYGKPYEITTCSGILLPGNFCLGVWVTEEGYYHIGHYRIPQGYCPMYPDGQDRKKEGTTTENMKFFTYAACPKLYPGFDGLFGNGACYPRRCYILIQ